MSNKLVKDEMMELHSELERLIKEKEYNLLDSTVIDYSQRLDKLIVKYIKGFK